MRSTTALVCAAALAAGCGERMLDVEDVERTTAERLEQAVGHAPRAIDCPDEIAGSAGTTARCTLTAPDGSRIGVTIEVLDDEGRFEARVDEGPARR